MTEHERSTTPEVRRAVSADGRYVVTFVDDGPEDSWWHVADTHEPDPVFAMVETYPDAPEMDAATVLSLWEAEMEGR